MECKTVFIALAIMSAVAGVITTDARAATNADGGQTNSPVTVDEVVGLVLSNSPALASARLKWQAMRERPEIARALPDPMLTYGYWFQSVETRVGPMNQQVGVAQKILFPGKLSLAGKKASEEALQAFWQYQALTRELIMRAQMLYYDLYQVEQTRRILEEQLGIYQQTIASARYRFEVGKTSEQDVLKAQLAYSGIKQRLLDLMAQRATAQARLNALVSLPGETSITTTEELPHESSPELQQAIEIATQYRQELKEANVAIERNETAVAIAKKDWWPDVTLGVQYTQVNPNIYGNPPENGKDAVMGTISINLPIWFGKLKAERREAEKNLEASREAQRQMADSVDADVRDAWFQVRTAGDQVVLFRDSLLPQALQTYRASSAGYETAKISFIELFDSERALLNFKLGLITEETDLAKSLATLERALGVDLNAVPPTDDPATVDHMENSAK